MIIYNMATPVMKLMLTSVIDLIFWFAVLIVLSYFLDRMWSMSLGRIIYVIFAAPGIIIHELSHYIACKLTGAHVAKVKLISMEGGSVTHGPPERGGVLGQALISMAPFFGIPMVLILLALLFDQVEFFNCDLTWNRDYDWEVGSIVVGTFRSAFKLIKTNLFDNMSPWFLLYLYLAASLTTALAPSKQDFKNAWIGLLAGFILIIGWALLNDNLLDGLGWKAPGTYFILDLLGWIVAIGLVLALFGLLLSLPFFIAKRLSRS
jgi:hypothetical protein